MSCDLDEVTEGLGNELCSFSNPSVASPTSQFNHQPFFRISYVTSSSRNSPGEPPMVLLQFSQHWSVVHLHHTLAAALQMFQRLYALSGKRIVLCCTAPLTTPPVCGSGMRNTSEVDNIEQYYHPISRRVLPPLDIVYETTLFSNIHGTESRQLQDKRSLSLCWSALVFNLMPGF